MLDFINCSENAQRKLAIMFLINLNAYDAKICIMIFGATFLFRVNGHINIKICKFHDFFSYYPFDILFRVHNL